MPMLRETQKERDPIEIFNLSNNKVMKNAKMNGVAKKVYKWKKEMQKEKQKDQIRILWIRR